MFCFSSSNVIAVVLPITIIILSLIKCIHLKTLNDEDKKALYPEKCHVIPTEKQIQFAHFNESETRTKRNIDLNKNFKIHTHYHSSFYRLAHEILDLYKNELIPEAITYWEESLQVKYPYNPIFLGRSCATSQVSFQRSSKIVNCEIGCSQETKCGDYIVIPEEHLDVCRYCVAGSCKEKGEKRHGVNADFILYISAINTEHCSNSNTVAFASYCQLESRYNRPVAGYVNICPQSVSTKQSDIHSALATLKHEILHALGFSAGLYAFFLDQNGKPLTERDSTTGKPPFSQKTNMYEPSEKVVKVVTRENWKTNDGFIKRNVTLIVTPRVVTEVRQHFNCSTLEGAELEDQGDIGTRHTHWEKRVFENEAMTGTYTQNSVFSRITFAFLEDTGWYVANYSYAEDFAWGKNLGCEFVKESCKNWIDNRQQKGISIRPFCNNLPNSYDLSSKYECNTKRDAVLLCNLMRYNESIPMQYRNFNSTLPLTQFSRLFNGQVTYDYISKHIGGSVVLADYCPFMQQVSWSINNDVVRDSKCTFEENKPDFQKNYVLEDYGSSSKCILHNRTWQIHTDRCQYRKTVSKTVGCYTYTCDTNQGLVIKILNNKIICSYKNQIVDFIINNDEKIYFGNIVCPSCEELCSGQITCPDSTTDWKQTQQSTLSIQFLRNNFYSKLDSQTEYCLKEISSFATRTTTTTYLFSSFLLLIQLV